MTLAPRAVLVHRRTEFDELVARHGTSGQARFFLAARGSAIAGVQSRHRAAKTALAQVAGAIPADWRRGTVERADLPRWAFSPEDVVLVVGQDGLVANAAKYLAGQLVIGFNPDPDRNPGILVPHRPAAARALLAAVASPRGGPDAEQRVMVCARSDDGQELAAVNEIYVGQPSHQTARYTLQPPGAGSERQASSGVIVSTGTGATGWGRSVWQERHSTLELPAPAERRLAWFVREAWPSPATGTMRTEGVLAGDQQICLTAESDLLVAFGDGMEWDAIAVTSGQQIRVAIAAQTLRMLP